MAHMLDSIGITRYPQWQYDAVRVGAMLYGNTPNGYAQPEKIQPVGRFCARVTRVFMVKAGELIGYDDDPSLMHDTRVAVISAGYADGYPRVFSGKGEIRDSWPPGTNTGPDLHGSDDGGRDGHPRDCPW